MFVTSQDGNVYLLQDTDSDGRADSQRTFSSGYYFLLVDDLPFDVHMNNNLKFGPDGWLYVGNYVNDAIYRICYGSP